MAYNDKFITVDSNIKELNEKVLVNIKDITDKIFWYLKFNLCLDKKSINGETMKVTYISGLKVKTTIEYNIHMKCITIEPLESYEQDEYYILHISKDVCSENGRKIGKDVHILFKLKNNIIVQYQELPENVVVNEPFHPDDKQKKSKNNRIKKIYSFTKNKNEEDPEKKEQLPYDDSFKLDYFLGALGILFLIVGIFLNMVPLIALGAGICIPGFNNIYKQLVNRKSRSIFMYNMGVKLFNKGSYKKAEKIFLKSYDFYKMNEYAEYALERAEEIQIQQEKNKESKS